MSNYLIVVQVKILFFMLTSFEVTSDKFNLNSVVTGISKVTLLPTKIEVKGFVQLGQFVSALLVNTLSGGPERERDPIMTSEKKRPLKKLQNEESHRHLLKIISQSLKINSSLVALYAPFTTSSNLKAIKDHTRPSNAMLD